jgi:hypothetical protein
MLYSALFSDDFDYAYNAKSNNSFFALFKIILATRKHILLFCVA